MEATAQLNVRLDPQTKRDADDMLARSGLTPSQVVRGLYENLAGGGRKSKQLLELLGLAKDPKAKKELCAKAEAMARFRSSLVSHYEALGIPLEQPGAAACEQDARGRSIEANSSDDDILFDAMEGKLAERGLA